jgi:hypothetical protein
MSETENKLICSICLCPLNNNVIFTPCIHGFHNECITPWLESKSHFRLIPCPLCKHDISILLGPRDENNLYENDPDMDVIDIEPIVSNITGERPNIRNEPVNFDDNRIINRIADIIMNGPREDINRNAQVIRYHRPPTIIPIMHNIGEEKGVFLIQHTGTGRITIPIGANNIPVRTNIERPPQNPALTPDQISLDAVIRRANNNRQARNNQ